MVSPAFNICFVITMHLWRCYHRTICCTRLFILKHPYHIMLQHFITNADTSIRHEQEHLISTPYTDQNLATVVNIFIFPHSPYPPKYPPTVSNIPLPSQLYTLPSHISPYPLKSPLPSHSSPYPLISPPTISYRPLPSHIAPYHLISPRTLSNLPLPSHSSPYPLISPPTLSYRPLPSHIAPYRLISPRTLSYRPLPSYISPTISYRPLPSYISPTISYRPYTPSLYSHLYITSFQTYNT